ncbi:MAG: T9SS type A sorting domain-containing protein [Bacteroidetes bacterium]|nr:MAG: T9SS type A sorting domain-containing protein [Bacteroidota bacterium]
MLYLTNPFTTIIQNRLPMKKILLWVLFAAFALNQAAAQSAKITPPAKGPVPPAEKLKLHPWPGKSEVPAASNPFGLSGMQYQPVKPLVAVQATETEIRTVRGENGLPILLEGKTSASGSADSEKPMGERALEYLGSLAPAGLKHAAQEFTVRSIHTDKQGNAHVRLDQVWQGVPVYGGELIAHTENGIFIRANGRYYPTPGLASVTPALSDVDARQRVEKQLTPGTVKTSWSNAERQLVGGQEFQAELVIYHPGRKIDAERLAWHVTLYPNLLRRMVFFVDAQTGEILYQYDHTCAINGGRCVSGQHHATASAVPDLPEMPAEFAPPPSGGPVVATGVDLNNQSRSFGAWMEGSVIYLEDAGQTMFNAGASNMPGDPVGAIISLDAKNTSPEIPSTFDYSLVTSGSTTFNNKNAVSTHWNAIQSYSYFETTHSRNSIDGVGGNILSLFNVSEADGTSMENAFWNGAAMWYGNGGASFTELAGGLDVGGHEMTHGVIEKTANLEYLDESGALNESFADIFAVCIDRDDWKIGEDVVKPGSTTNNCLRDLQFPNNGTPAQPKHVNEQYVGPLDNGGVHINSGITNRAFYLFASNAAVGLEKAEKVYYKALEDYLVRSSQFVDCRIAVIQAANDLYGSTVANAAADAFTTVGIVGNQGGNYLGELVVNPGTDFVVCNTNDGQSLDLALGNGTILGTLYDQGVASRPSVSDNGMQIVFVSTVGHIIGVDLAYNGNDITYQAYELSFFPEWRSAAISKDGRFVAALTTVEDNRIYVFDLADPLGASETFFLYNPTYSQTPQITGEVRFADVLEFDYSGEYVIYDAYNELSNSQGEDLSYWDIGFLKFWENNAFLDGGQAPVSKLFTGIPERSSIGNPTLSKNAPYVLAFDFYDGLANQYDIYGVNFETGDYDILVGNNGEWAWPNYTRLDDQIMFQREFGNGRNLFLRDVLPNRITGDGNESLFIQNRDWGAWFANGNRSLMVDTDEPTAAPLQLQVAPNPATDRVRLTFTTPQSGPVQVMAADLLGRTVLTRQWDLPQGENQVELDLSQLPAGTYALRLLAGGTGTTLKVVKR